VQPGCSSARPKSRALLRGKACFFSMCVAGPDPGPPALFLPGRRLVSPNGRGESRRRSGGSGAKRRERGRERAENQGFKGLEGAAGRFCQRAPFQGRALELSARVFPRAPAPRLDCLLRRRHAESSRSQPSARGGHLWPLPKSSAILSRSRLARAVCFSGRGFLFQPVSRFTAHRKEIKEDAHERDVGNKKGTTKKTGWLQTGVEQITTARRGGDKATGQRGRTLPQLAPASTPVQIKRQSFSLGGRRLGSAFRRTTPKAPAGASRKGSRKLPKAPALASTPNMGPSEFRRRGISFRPPRFFRGGGWRKRRKKVRTRGKQRGLRGGCGSREKRNEGGGGGVPFRAWEGDFPHWSVHARSQGKDAGPWGRRWRKTTSDTRGHESGRI